MDQVKQVRILYDQATSGLVVTLVVSLTLGTFLITEEATVPTIGFWWLATVLVVAWRWRLIQRFRSAKDVDSNPNLWSQRFIIGSTLAGLTWGIGGAASALEVTLHNQALILIVVACMVATAALFLGSVVAAYVGYLLGATLPLLVWMLWQRDIIHFVIAILTCVFIAGTWVAALKFSRLLEQTLYFESKNKALADELEVRVEARTAELEQRNIELEQFAYTVSHDLKTPLVTVNGFVGLLAKDVEAGDIVSAAKDMQQIVSAITKMGHSLDDLLELARVGSVVNEPQLLSLNQLSDEVIFAMQGLIAESGAEIEIAPDLPAVLADKNRIAEVIQNLFENAIKFCGDDNTPKISVDSEIQGNWVQCRVKDNGIGIDPLYHDKVFELFDRLDPKIDGTGVGLALVKRIIEVHDGKVWIESEGTGQGTRICFTLPAAIGETQ
jgi:signal transduction histidine kinase